MQVEISSENEARQFEAQQPPTLNFSPSTSPSSTSSSASSRNSIDSETTPRNFHSLAKLYEETQALFIVDPKTFQEVAQKEEWHKAMEEELIAIQKNETWELVDLLEGKTPISVKWVFWTKYLANGNIHKYKA